MARQSQSATTTRHLYRSARTQLLRLLREIISRLQGLSHTTSQCGTGEVQVFQENAYCGMPGSQLPGQVVSKRQQEKTWTTSQPNQLQRANDTILPAVAEAVKICIWNLSSKCLYVDTADFRLLRKFKDVSTLRESFCKYRASRDSFNIFNFFLIFPNKEFSELFSKT